MLRRAVRWPVGHRKLAGQGEQPRERLAGCGRRADCCHLDFQGAIHWQVYWLVWNQNFAVKMGSKRHNLLLSYRRSRADAREKSGFWRRRNFALALIFPIGDYPEP